MACRGPDDDLPRGPDPRVPQLQRELDLKAAMLCGILTVLETNDIIGRVLTAVNWDEVGCNRADLEAWWNNHKVQDAQRRIKEDAGKLPAGEYKVREEVTFQDRHWFVTKVVVANGVTMVAMVTADNKQPVRNETFKVRKA